MLENLEALVEGLGPLGVVVMLLLQILQVIVAVIPGEPFELLMGLMYGTLPGLILSLTGTAIGTALVFMAVKKWGIGFARKFVSVDKFAELGFLKSPAKRDSLIFVLFLIPGTPKDVLTYFAPFTGIPLAKFLPLTIIARIPSIVTSTLVGAGVGEGEFLRSAIIFAATAVIGAVGIFVNSKLQNKLNENNNDTNNENHTEN